MVSSEISSSDLSEYIQLSVYYFCFKDKKYKKFNNCFCNYINQFLGETFIPDFSFLQITPKFSDFIHSDDCIGKIICKSIRLYTVLIEKKGLVQ